MAVKDQLGNRMKHNYEDVSRVYLTKRTPVIIRIDGKAFHTFTKKLRKPFDMVLNKAMAETMHDLCKNIQGCVLGYTQSDEITLVLVDYQTLETNAWFDYNLQKITSISASMATMFFAKRFSACSHNMELNDYPDTWFSQKKHETHEYLSMLFDTVDRGAMFDARAFNIPKEEVANCLLWRQFDATRNSVEMVGHAYFSQNKLNHVHCSGIKELLLYDKGIVYDDLPVSLQRGICCYKGMIEKVHEGNRVMRNEWILDYYIPMFNTDEGRRYINDKILL